MTWSDTTPTARPGGDAGHERAGRGRSLPDGLLPIALVVLAVCAYLPVRHCEYIWDDAAYVYENETLTSADGLRRIWFEIGATPQYYPLVHSSFWVEYRLWELDPTGFHLVNVLLHALGAVLLWRILRLLGLPGAWLAAAVFAVHPIEVESVAWITERKNVLSGVFALAGLLVYLRAARREAGGETRPLFGVFWFATLLLFLCALLSKTVTASLPAVLLVLLWWQRGRIPGRDLIRTVPLFAVGIGFGLLTAWMEREQVRAIGADWDFSLLERAQIAGRILWHYPARLLLPIDLSFIYPRYEVNAASALAWLGAAGAALLVLVLFALRRRIGRGALAAVLCYGGVLFPALGFFNVYPMRFSFVADHFQYHAGIALIALFVAILASLVRSCLPAARRLPALLGAILLGTLGFLTWNQCAIYQDQETLWRDTLEKNPDAWIAHNNLGNLLSRRGEFQEALPHYRRVIELKADHESGHFNLARALGGLGRLDEAIREFELAREATPDWPQIHANLGQTLHRQGRLEEAITSLREALRLLPEPATHFYLADALHTDGQLQLATRHYQQALVGSTEYPSLIRLAQLYRSMGRQGLAMQAVQRALQLQPEAVDAQLELADCLDADNRQDEALALLQRLLDTHKNHPRALTRAALILSHHPDAEKRQMEQAILLAKTAVTVTRQKNAEVLFRMAQVYLAADRKQRARAAAEAAAPLARRTGDRPLLEEIRAWQRRLDGGP